jgi:hypothetical protein
MYKYWQGQRVCDDALLYIPKFLKVFFFFFGGGFRGFVPPHMFPIMLVMVLT